MAGHGRGKPTTSFNTEQLGLAKGELPAQVLQPPSAYPLLELHISNFESTNELEYLVELKREFAEYMRDSVNHVLPDVQKKDIERYSDHYQDTITDNSEQESKYDWNRMPAELSSKKFKKAANNLKKKNSSKITTEIKKKRRRIINDDDDDVSNKQNTEPEQQRNKQTQGNIAKEAKGTKEEEEEEDEEDSEEEVEEIEEVDEEMDHGTDYFNNYFDNGETFDDEDENMDDGPVY